MTLLEIGLFILIGGIVSLDVAGLTAVKSSTYTGGPRQLAKWAIQNAIWHAALLCVYGLLTVAVGDWALPRVFQALIDYLRTWDAPILLLSVVHEIGNHFYVAFSSLTIIIVWRAYTNKIVENPFQVKVEKEGGQRKMVRMLFKAVGASAKFTRDQLESMAVAMDMLALAFLMRSLDLFEKSYEKVASISAIILITVLFVTIGTALAFRHQFSALLGSSLRSDVKQETLVQILITIRLIEPLLIFYFLCEMMSFAVWRHMSSSSLFFIGAAFLVFALTKQVGLHNIKSTAEDMVDNLIKRQPHAA